MTFRYRLHARLYAVGALFHLTLPDAHQWSWFVPDVLLGAGAVWLLLRPPTPRTRSFIAAWGACAIGVAWPLLLLDDALTQSVFLLVQALVVATTMAPTDDRSTAWTLRTCTLAIYFIAAFHKMNTGFLDADVSCATGGVELLAENWSLPLDASWLRPVWPGLFLAVELSLVLAFLFRPAWALLLGLMMHIPLTIVFAPAFAWVMLPGWIWFFGEDDLRFLTGIFRTRAKIVFPLGLGVGFTSALLYFRDHSIPYPFWQLNELALWFLLVGVSVALFTRGDRLGGRCAWREGRSAHTAPKWMWAFVVAILVNASTPYLGIQFHHAGAMLSNLRVDQGCWNHLLVPEAIRVQDPYVRVQTAHVGGEPDGAAALESWIETHLWHPASLRRELTQWCAAGAAPLELRLTHAGREHIVADACETLPLPAQRPGLFQTNLLRECPQRCIH